MINSISIGKVISARLSTITGVKVYPLIAENSTTFPFIIYSRDSIAPEFCKDGNMEDGVSVTIKVVTDTYFQGIDIAQQVREKLSLHNYNSDNMTIDSKFANATEYYAENSYIQSLVFNMTIINN